MKKHGKGGGNTISGLKFEENGSLYKLFLRDSNYSINRDNIYYKGEVVAHILSKHILYRYLKEKGINYKNIISKKLIPDEAIYVTESNTLFIIEMKSQETNGSVDEKLQTCDFKRQQYIRLVQPLDMRVKYSYVLSNWFRKDQYKDVLKYILSTGCNYHFEQFPLQELGLPGFKSK